MSDLLIINGVCLAAQTPEGVKILRSVWSKCRRSPWINNQVCFKPEDFRIAERELDKHLGIGLKFPLL